MKKSAIFFLIIILTACATPTPQVTITSEVTVTLTPAPTQSPEPALPAEVVEAQKFLGEGFEVSPDGKVIDKTLVKEIVGLTIVPFDEKTMINRGRPTDPVPTWALQRVYEFEDKADFTVKMTQYDIKLLENSDIDMFGWVYENGEFTRQKVEFAAPNNGSVEIDGYSPEEVQYMIITNSSTDPEHRIASFPNLNKMVNEILNRRLIDHKDHIRYKGVDEIIVNGYLWGKNFIPFANSDGTFTKVDTAEFLVVALGDRTKGLIAWYGEGGNPLVVAVEFKYVDFPAFFNLYWKMHDINE